VIRSGPLLLLLLLAAPLAAAPGTWHDQLPPALVESLASGRPILVDLYADWCGWCKELDTEVFPSPRFREFAKRFVLLRLDVEDGAAGAAIHDRFRVSTLPTILVMDGHKARLAQVEGFLPTEELIAELERQLGSRRSPEKSSSKAAAATR